MKVLRWVLLLLGTVSLYFFFKDMEAVFAGSEWSFSALKTWLRSALSLPNIYFNAIRLFLRNRQAFIGVLTRNWSFGLNLLIPILAFMVAGNRNRSGFWWWIVCSYLPFFAIMLALRPEGDEAPELPQSESESSYTPSSYTPSSYSSSKSCSACGKAVSSSASAGQSCPHCGAYWSTENTTYQN